MEQDNLPSKLAPEQLIPPSERQRRLAQVYRLLIQLASRDAITPSQDNASPTSSTVSSE